MRSSVVFSVPGVLAVLIAWMAVPLSGVAGVVMDPSGDFLASYTGPQGGDLDVLAAEVRVNTSAGTIQFFSTMAADIGTTTGVTYVFGLNRGAGTERFNTGGLPVGAGVFFDSVVQLRPNGTGQFNDLITPANNFVFSAGTVLISGASIGTKALNLALFPTKGFAPLAYTWNLWPRMAGITGNAAIPDFAPDASMAGVTAVPEPASGLVFGLCLAAGAMGFRRRSMLK